MLQGKHKISKGIDCIYLMAYTINFHAIVCLFYGYCILYCIELPWRRTAFSLFQRNQWTSLICSVLNAKPEALKHSQLKINTVFLKSWRSRSPVTKSQRTICAWSQQFFSSSLSTERHKYLSYDSDESQSSLVMCIFFSSASLDTLGSGNGVSYQVKEATVQHQMKLLGSMYRILSPWKMHKFRHVLSLFFFQTTNTVKFTLPLSHCFYLSTSEEQKACRSQHHTNIVLNTIEGIFSHPSDGNTPRAEKKIV